VKFLLLYIGLAVALGLRAGVTGRPARASLLAVAALLLAAGFLSPRVIG